MLRYVALACLVALASCSGASDVGTSTLPSPSPTTTALFTAPGTIEEGQALQPCEPPPVAPAYLPERVAEEAPAPSAVEYDRWTAIPGTSLKIWADDLGEPVVALVRGALPPERWLTTPAVVRVLGVEAALGPLSEGMWAVAWFDGPDRCDDYTLYVYPPTNRDEAQRVAESIR